MSYDKGRIDIALCSGLVPFAVQCELNGYEFRIIRGGCLHGIGRVYCVPEYRTDGSAKIFRLYFCAWIDICTAISIDWIWIAALLFFIELNVPIVGG
ncbi:hypothetical protein BMS3Abin07_01227 [bacterium BMS3Abin07]|nr:hypothetical protein BMS3Abin07_01227 [bacterium BMS3Abin07]GBE31551.1 hypothetical protein BMS3Bbin05_00453 [bacterium BMS3Bbin05]